MEQIHLLINDNGEVEIVKTKFFGATNTKPSRIKVTPSNFSLEDCGKSVIVGCSGAETRDCIEKAMPGWKVISQGATCMAVKNYMIDRCYVGVIVVSSVPGTVDEQNVYVGGEYQSAVNAVKHAFNQENQLAPFKLLYGRVESWKKTNLVKTDNVWR